MNDIDQKWWDIIKPPAGQAIGAGQTPDPGGFSSPFMSMMGSGGLEKWMQNPRVPGSGGTPQPPAQPQPQAPAPQQGGGPMNFSTAEDIWKNGYGYHPTQGFVNLNSQDQGWGTYAAMALPGYSPEELLAAYLRDTKNRGGYNSGEAAGVSGVSGDGPDGTDGGIG